MKMARQLAEKQGNEVRLKELRQLENELPGHPVGAVKRCPSRSRQCTRGIFDKHSFPACSNAEIDLVIEFSAKDRWAVEVKGSVPDPSPSKGFYIGSEDIKATRRMLLYPGKERYQLDPNSEAMPLEKLLA